MKSYNGQWNPKDQTFSEWAKDGVESKHIDLRPTGTKDREIIAYYQRLAQKEPDFT